MNQADLPLSGQTALITGGAHRVGKILALAAARAGADIILHYSRSQAEAEETGREIEQLGRKVHLLQADLSQPETARALMPRAFAISPPSILINSASIYETHSLADTSPEDWENTLNLNLSAPFFLTQAFARLLPEPQTGRILNILDWRALRPTADHFPYTISKAALAALTRSSAAALAPRITVNGLALGAILPPADGQFSPNLLKLIPANRWAGLDEVAQAAHFLLTGPAYITGEILHLDGGRHLI
ncbi:MAG TPA: SDR family oxidoreductase [Anaerolineaceae bacterium]|nr:SDR family oxidoreductase [Anaerolineaceae bacterium]HPN50313.1 SDR family oxidoreductase [Anaerolineaceae bacterium]